MRGYLVAILLLTSFIVVARQQQTVRGTVTDESSNAPIAYASVIVPGSSPLIGATTDSAGTFSLVGLPIGTCNLQVSALGYKPYSLENIEVSASREVVLAITLRSADTLLKEVQIRYRPLKEKPINNMATVSARMLSVEEAKRYAGAFDDPSRLVTSFAGVAGNIGSNGIVVRGNAPQYLQWKMEGVEIPNPNHFADLTTFGGGGLTALSANLLSNCDFFSGAFPAEYSNALSGVFDIFMRNGNNQKYEHTFQLGLIGIDAASEGPLGKKGGASYLFNYRYSTLTLMKPFLPENAAGVKYQDLSFKFNLPTKKAGVFTLWGIGLKDGSGGKHKADSTQWLYRSSREDADITQYMAAAGISHKLFMGRNTYLKTVLAVSNSGIGMKIDELDNKLNMVPRSRIANASTDITLTSFLNKKINNKHTNRTGISVRAMGYNLSLSNAPVTGALLADLVNASGFTELLTAYSNSGIDITDRLKANVGINGQYFMLNGRHTVEPRIGLKWQATGNKSFAVAWGLHSRLERLNFYFNRSLKTGEEAVNKDLDFSKAHHFVTAYDWSISELLHVKVEAYYQYLFNMPVIKDSSFSFVNMDNDWFFAERLQNTGLGRNYGLELTLERYMSRGFYYMLTTSLFKSQYRGGDMIWRDTRFNRSFLINCLGGKEWRMGAGRHNTLGLNLRFSYQGGDRYSPVNLPLSLATGQAVLDEHAAFSLQLPSTLTVHFTACYKMNRKHNTHEVAFKMLNITGQKEFQGYAYNLITHTIDKREDLIFIPNLSYRVEF